MESATQPDATDHRRRDGAGERRRRTATETFEVLSPVDGSVIAEVAIDSPDRRRRRRRPACAPTSPPGRRSGSPGASAGSSSLRDWILANQDARRRHDAGGDRQGPRRRRARGLLLSSTRSTSAATGPEASSPTRSISPHNPLLKAKRAKIVYRPFGVVGMISPWNFPVILSLGDAIPALLAGNAVVIKPSEFTPLTLMEIVRGLAGGGRRPRRARRSSTAWARPAARWSTRSTTCSSPAPSGPARS